MVAGVFFIYKCVFYTQIPIINLLYLQVRKQVHIFAL